MASKTAAPVALVVKNGKVHRATCKRATGAEPTTPEAALAEQLTAASCCKPKIEAPTPTADAPGEDDAVAVVATTARDHLATLHKHAARVTPRPLEDEADTPPRPRRARGARPEAVKAEIPGDTAEQIAEAADHLAPLTPAERKAADAARGKSALPAPVQQKKREPAFPAPLAENAPAAKKAEPKAAAPKAAPEAGEVQDMKGKRVRAAGTTVGYVSRTLRKAGSGYLRMEWLTDGGTTIVWTWPTGWALTRNGSTAEAAVKNLGEAVTLATQTEQAEAGMENHAD